MLMYDFGVKELSAEAISKATFGESISPKYSGLEIILDLIREPAPRSIRMLHAATLADVWSRWTGRRDGLLLIPLLKRAH